MRAVSPETCWASYKYEIKFWYTVASCWIFFVNYTMMHGSTNIKFTIRMTIMKAYFYLVYWHQYYTVVAWIAQPPAANNYGMEVRRNLVRSLTMITIAFLLQTVQAGSGAHPAFYSMGAGESLSLWKRGLGTKLPTQPHIMRRLWMAGAVRPHS
jgi:hypothetical protein